MRTEFDSIPKSFTIFTRISSRNTEPISTYRLPPCSVEINIAKLQIKIADRGDHGQPVNVHRDLHHLVISREETNVPAINAKLLAMGEEFANREICTINGDTIRDDEITRSKDNVFI